MIERIKLFLLSLAICAGCVSETPSLSKRIAFKSPLEGLPNLGRVTFDNPQIGQRNYYLRFVVRKTLNSGEPEFSYRNDTLVFAVTGKVSNKWILKEFMLSGSISNLTLNDTTIVTHYMQIGADSIHFNLPEGSSIHFSPVGNNLTFPIVGSDKIENKNCLPIFDHRTDIWSAYTINYTQFGEHFDSLSNYFDYTEMSFDGHGYTYIYTSDTGFTRIAWISAWNIWTADGWDLLPQ
ncbi:MAG: hypothetical protein JNM78_15525 [Cyclobacteriaceae bacterium]|nr:hypothetical protein [Cyclobacteriaceae bacterium]